MSLFITFLATQPPVSMLVLLAGITLSLCGGLGHARPVRSALYAGATFLVILLALIILFTRAEPGGFLKEFALPTLGVLAFVLPGIVLWLHLRYSLKKSPQPGSIAKWLRPFMLAGGIVTAAVSALGALKFLAWFI